MIELILFFLGGTIASFTQLVSERIPRGESINGRSHCIKCKHILAPIDLIPVLSYIFLKGRCKWCDSEIPLSHLLFEIGIGTIFVGVYVVFGVGRLPIIFFIYFLITCSLPILLVDISNHIILDEFLYLLFFGGLLFNRSHLQILFGSVLMTTFILWLLYYFSNGRALGFGDVKLGFVIGSLLPLPYALIALYIAFLTGGLISAILILFRMKNLKSAIAFGPFLLLGLISSFILYTR